MKKQSWLHDKFAHTYWICNRISHHDNDINMFVPFFGESSLYNLERERERVVSSSSGRSHPRQKQRVPSLPPPSGFKSFMSNLSEFKRDQASGSVYVEFDKCLPPSRPRNHLPSQKDLYVFWLSVFSGFQAELRLGKTKTPPTPSTQTAWPSRGKDWSHKASRVKRFGQAKHENENMKTIWSLRCCEVWSLCSRPFRSFQPPWPHNGSQRVTRVFAVLLASATCEFSKFSSLQVFFFRKPTVMSPRTTKIIRVNHVNQNNHGEPPWTAGNCM